MTPQEQVEVDKINQMSQFEMCHLWRFAPPGHPYLDTSKPFWTHFEKRFKDFGGFTPEISKALGWER
jgi:hypothetical protein